MKAIMLLADKGTLHTDGTFSMLRIGINKAESPNEPISLLASLAILISADPSESGNHEFEVRIIDEDGKDVASKFGAQFSLQTGRNPRANMLIDLQLQFPKFGRYQISLNVDKGCLADWPIEVVKSDGGAK